MFESDSRPGDRTVRKQQQKSSVIVKINDDYRIESTRYCWVVRRRRKGKWDALGYYPSLETALHGLVELRLRLSDAQSISEALAEVKSLVAALCRGLPPNLQLRVEEKTRTAH